MRRTMGSDPPHSSKASQEQNCCGGAVFKMYPTLATSWPVAHQASLSMELSIQEH